MNAFSKPWLRVLAILIVLLSLFLIIDPFKDRKQSDSSSEESLPSASPTSSPGSTSTPQNKRDPSNLGSRDKQVSHRQIEHTCDLKAGETLVFYSRKLPDGRHEILNLTAEDIDMGDGSLGARLLFKIIHLTEDTMGQTGLDGLTSDERTLKWDHEKHIHSMRQLAQAKGTDIITAPSVITQGNQPANIQISMSPEMTLYLDSDVHTISPEQISLTFGYQWAPTPKNSSLEKAQKSPLPLRASNWLKIHLSRVVSRFEARSPRPASIKRPSIPLSPNALKDRPILKGHSEENMWE